MFGEPNIPIDRGEPDAAATYAIIFELPHQSRMHVCQGMCKRDMLHQMPAPAYSTQVLSALLKCYVFMKLPITRIIAHTNVIMSSAQTSCRVVHFCSCWTDSEDMLNSMLGTTGENVVGITPGSTAYLSVGGSNAAPLAACSKPLART
eukprot:GHUV01031520.1.p1 GENE.GHUV01031520.1~~GHUV01031520.1.p1  ORF type:complete len:148 (-),score=20.67 GHUV01031520.1:145-588(-)